MQAVARDSRLHLAYYYIYKVYEKDVAAKMSRGCTTPVASLVDRAGGSWRLLCDYERFSRRLLENKPWFRRWLRFRSAAEIQTSSRGASSRGASSRGASWASRLAAGAYELCVISFNDRWRSPLRI